MATVNTIPGATASLAERADAPFESVKPASTPFPETAPGSGRIDGQGPFVAGQTATLRLNGEAIPVTIIHVGPERVVVECVDNGQWIIVRPAWLEA